MICAKRMIPLSLILFFLTLTTQAQDTSKSSKPPFYPNTNAKDMDGDIPWRVQDEFTPIPVLWIIKDSDQWLAEVDKMKYVVLYDVSDGYDPPSNWDSPQSDHVVYFHDFNNITISQDYWYWLTMTFEGDGAFNGKQPNGAPFTPANLGYGKGDTISFTLRLYGKDGIWPIYTDVKLDQDFKVHVGEEVLPKLENWYWGDVHNHGWKTDNLYEYGEPTDAKALAAEAMGLSYVVITDHASDLSTSKWNALGQECAQYSTADLRLLRGEEMHANQGGLLDVRHMLGFDMTTYVEGAENGTYSINQILGGPSPSNNLTAQNAFAYAAHPTDPSIGWTFNELEQALTFDPFVGLQFFNERNSHFSEVNWSDDDDEYHPWGGDESIDPYNRDWTVTNPSWDLDLLQGVNTWDQLLSDRLRPHRKVFMAGGADAHGGWNYRVYRTTSLDLTATPSAMGKVRTAIYSPVGLTDSGILNALKNGRTIITDGPAAVFGIDGDGDGELYGPNDSLIGDGPVVVTLTDKVSRFRFEWASSAEYGDVVCIRLYRGNKNTGGDPKLVWESYPNSYGGAINGPLVSTLAPVSGRHYYFRMEAYTFDPNGPAVPSGEVSNYTYDAINNNYRYRCFTNPIWVFARFAQAPPPVRHP